VRSWKILEEIYKSGKVKAIGVANFTIKHLDELKKYAEIMPMVNEFECHPLCIRTQLNSYCKQNDIQVLAYASLCGMDQRLRVGAIADIAARHDKSSAQIILKWHVQNGRVPIFGTSKRERITAYANIFDFELSEEELEAIDGYNVNYRAFPDSEQCDFTKGIWIGWEKYKDCCP
jgi:diketogulonate reductase-like aldo/keto reductase